MECTEVLIENERERELRLFESMAVGAVLQPKVTVDRSKPALNA